MNAMLKPETPKDAARRLAAGAIRDGFKPVALHRYNDADGSPWSYRIRMKNAGGDKWMRPMYFDGARYVLGEPAAPDNGKPIYRSPYPLVESDPVVIVEGEQKADALAELGVTATTSGSASSAEAADWASLKGRIVLLWPDNDSAGRKYAEQVTAILHAQGCTVEVIDVAALNLPDKGDCVDWLAEHPNATAADVLALPIMAASQHAAIAVSASDTFTSAPEPLRRPLPLPEPYPTDELGPILAPACASLRRVIQASDAVCGASLLAAASLAVQGLADVRHDGRVHPLSLWFLTVAESGERKSTVDAEAMRPARDYERELSIEYLKDNTKHESLMEEWNARRKVAKKQASKGTGEGLADALGKIGKPPDAPPRPTLIVADFTAEGLSKLLAVGRPSVGAFTDEAALVFGGHGMTKETVTRTAGTLSKLWDSGTLDRVRASEGATKLWGRRLALHLMAQPVIAERALSDDVLAGQGFLARCLLAWPESTAGTRPYRSENLRHDAALSRYAARMAELLALALPLASDTHNELTPRTLPLSPDAATAWRGLHDAVEVGMKAGGPFATVKPWASKTPEQCLRIAGVLTVLENTNAQEIDAATVERAAELALWHLHEAVRLAGTAELSPEVRDAEALVNWCHATGRTMLHSGAALRLGPARIRERETFTVAMAELVRAGWAHLLDGGTVIDNKHRRHVWRIVPASEGG